ncbi:acetyltransferase [Roseobacter cerasinus]|uniref:Acetyltransferase n=1 Tax=Roseobacter cerasinus TaxID=2602289 RepID=A0A640VP59_9RHOB|nr:GNAT family N-acetyltransferase [Roseobacter cerasinus]GFE49527.1 acetyltransferase [Roseobacter cerasinus]
MTRITQTADLQACHALRRAVFMEEQGISEADEFDDLDQGALHFLAVQDGHAVGTARLLISGDTARVGRICVLKDQRGTGLGAQLIGAALEVARAQPGVQQARLGAQVSAIAFYEKLGFVTCGPVYDDAGIPHREMSCAL